MTNKTEVFINLNKCSEEQRKSLPQILEKAGQEIYFLAKPTLLSGKLDKYYPYLFFSLPSSNVWVFSHNKPDRTEITYHEFIKLIEGGESKEVLQVENNNVFFLDECIFTYCPTPNECKNGGCLSKSNNQ